MFHQLSVGEINRLISRYSTGAVIQCYNTAATAYKISQYRNNTCTCTALYTVQVQYRYRYSYNTGTITQSEFGPVADDAPLMAPAVPSASEAYASLLTL